MALGSEVTLDIGPTDSVPKHIASVVSRWVTVIDATGIDGADASPVTDPDAEITNSTTHIFKRDGRMGTFIVARMAYDDGVSGVTDPVVVLFGRASSSDQWEILRDKAGSITSVIATDTTNDVSNGTLNWTTPHASNNVWDSMGCNEFVFGVSTALVVTGDATTAYLEARII